MSKIGGINMHEVSEHEVRNGQKVSYPFDKIGFIPALCRTRDFQHSDNWISICEP